MTSNAPHLALQHRATELRLRADALRQQADILDRDAEVAEQRLNRLGLRSFYAGSLERVRSGIESPRWRAVEE